MAVASGLVVLAGAAAPHVVALVEVSRAQSAAIVALLSALYAVGGPVLIVLGFIIVVVVGSSCGGKE